MLYINQLDYTDIPYVHGTGIPEGPIHGTVARSGCGLCAACMMIDRLTTDKLSIEEAVRLSEDNACNVNRGTQMARLGPILAKKFNLTFSATENMDEALTCLQKGGCVIINVGGDHDDYKGVFSRGGHYIIAIAWDGEELCILDPSWQEERYRQEHVLGKVRQDHPFLYSKPQTVVEDTANRATPLYLFMRKKPE